MWVKYPHFYFGENMNKRYCVYVHINKFNRKMYIGITSNISQRWKACSYRECHYFYRAIKKYGWENFEHLAILDNLEYNMACICEISLIEKYNTTNSNFGYNLAKGGSGGATIFGERHWYSKEVFQYDLDGNFVRSWCNAQFASKELNISVSDIHANSRGIVKRAGNYQWSYDYVDKMKPYVRNKIYKNINTIYQFTLDWELVNIYYTIHDVPVSNRKQERIIRCCKFKNMTCDNYFWFYEKDLTEENIRAVKERYYNYHVSKKKINLRKPIIQYSIDKKIIKEYESVYDASDATGIKTGTIQHACKQSNTHYAMGYYWYYTEDVA